MDHRGPALAVLASMFGEDTFTIELHMTPAVEWLVQNKLIEKHPGGLFGSRCSYYRTEAGIIKWRELHAEQK